ncbi:MAG TPA: VOC family protein [Steroidobacteraceae bacterium]|nr:VOC family protein [Steroidobacteraceae bacterium]
MQFLANIDVDDLPKAIHFYQTAFRLKPGRRFGTHGIEMLGSSAPIYLLLKAPGTAPTNATTQPRSYRRHWTPVHLDFVVDDIQSAVQDALHAGAQLEAPVSTSPWGKLALMVDPFGHGFCFLQFLGRGYDEIAE